MSPSRQLQRVAESIVAGQLHGEAAFEAVVDVIAASETPPGAPLALQARIRDEVALGVRHDRALCELIYGPPAARTREEERPPSRVTTVPGEKPLEVRRPKRRDLERAAAEGRLRAPEPERRRRSRRPAEESIEELDPAPVDFPELAGAQSERKQRIVTGAVVVGALAVVAAVYYGFRSSPCDDLATHVCTSLGESCSVEAVRARFVTEGLNGTTCSTAHDTVRTLGDDPKAYRTKLVSTLGFDPTHEEGAAEQEEEPPPPPPPTPMAIVKGQTTMSSMIVDRTHIYWTVTEPPAVYRIRSIGGQPELLSQTPMPGQLGVSDNFAYWVSSATPPKMWADKVRGEHEPVSIELVEGFSPSLVAFMGPEAAFVDGQTGAVHIVAVANDTPTQLAGPGEPKPAAIAGNGQTVVWATPGPGANLMAAPRQGGAPRILAQGLTAAALLRLDDTHVYWSDPAAGSISRMALEGGAEQGLVVKGDPGITDFVVGLEQLYWSNAKTGQISVVPKGGGESRVIATGLDAPRYVELDGAAVYWESGGVVFRLPK